MPRLQHRVCCRSIRKRSGLIPAPQLPFPSTLPCRGTPNSGGGVAFTKTQQVSIFPLLNPAGSVSELKALGNQCEVRPAFVAGRSTSCFPFLHQGIHRFLPTPTGIPIPFLD